MGVLVQFHQVCVRLQPPEKPAWSMFLPLMCTTKIICILTLAPEGSDHRDQNTKEPGFLLYLRRMDEQGPGRSNRRRSGAPEARPSCRTERKKRGGPGEVLTDGRDAGMQEVVDSAGGRGRRPVGLHGMATHR
jgi:hypothetical protein